MFDEAIKELSAREPKKLKAKEEVVEGMKPMGDLEGEAQIGLNVELMAEAEAQSFNVYLYDTNDEQIERSLKMGRRESKTKAFEGEVERAKVTPKAEEEHILRPREEDKVPTEKDEERMKEVSNT